MSELKFANELRDRVSDIQLKETKEKLVSDNFEKCKLSMYAAAEKGIDHIQFNELNDHQQNLLKQTGYHIKCEHNKCFFRGYVISWSKNHPIAKL